MMNYLTTLEFILVSNRSEDIRTKVTEVLLRLPKINDDYPKNSGNFRRLPKISEDGPKLFDRYQKDCGRFWKSSKDSF